MKIGFTCGTWDLLHAGHVLMLREAKTQCDYLIVGLQTDPTIDRPDNKNKPVQSLVERYTQLHALEYVDEIVPYQTEADLKELLCSYPINVRVIGSEYKRKHFTGKDLCRERGIEIYYNKRDHDYSTTSLRERVENSPRSNKETIVTKFEKKKQ